MCIFGLFSYEKGSIGTFPDYNIIGHQEKGEIDEILLSYVKYIKSTSLVDLIVPNCH